MKAKRKTDVKLERQHITPEVAEKLLSHTYSTGFPQRSVNVNAVSRYAKEMEAGTWHSETADVIRLCDYEGGKAVLDGQHRLKAVAKSRIGQDMWVANGVPEEAFKYIDQGTPRTLSAVASAAGWPNPGQLSACGRMLFENSRGRDPVINKGTDIAAGTMFDRLLEISPTLVDLWNTYGVIIKKASKRCHVKDSSILFLFWHWEQANHDLAIEVITFLADSYQTQPPKPVFMLSLSRLDENYLSFINKAKQGNTVRTEVQREEMLRVLQFAWLSCVGTAPGCATETGFKKSFNRWVKKARDSQGAWAIV